MRMQREPQNYIYYLTKTFNDERRAWVLFVGPRSLFNLFALPYVHTITIWPQLKIHSSKSKFKNIRVLYLPWVGVYYIFSTWQVADWLETGLLALNVMTCLPRVISPSNCLAQLGSASTYLWWKWWILNFLLVFFLKYVKTVKSTYY
jgi:hypothetical protein